MAGITNFGAYVPLWRLSREVMARAWGTAPMKGERSVAGFDEDSITMAVEAGSDCLCGLERKEVDGLLLASTSFPYREKQSAAMVGTVLDLREDIVSSDFGNSLRAGSLALKAACEAVDSGAARNMLVVAADCRLGYPKTADEQAFGDGAAALMVGGSDVICEIEGHYTISNEIIDIWRTERQQFVNSWEARFVLTHGYNECMKKAISGVMSKCGLKPGDFGRVALYGPDARSRQGLAGSLGFDAKAQIGDSLLDEVGNTGASCALMALVAALEEAKPGERILFASYGDGADAFVLRVTEEIEKVRGSRGVKGHIGSKRMLPGYEKYLLYRELLEQPVEIFNIDSAATILWRDRRWVLRGHGSRCRKCGTVTFPIERVCYGCQSKDDFEEVRITDKKATVFTFSRDRLAGSSAEPSIVQVVAESEEGKARIYGIMTDCDPEEVEVGMPLEMTFRKIREARGYHNYFWKLRPVRKGES
jgi:3-hydroxy-3-methylglutaryl CoA synthase